MNKIYVLPVVKDAEIPFGPKNDTVAIVKSLDVKNAEVKSADTKSTDVKNADSKISSTGIQKPKAEKAETQYDFENIGSRIIELPVEAGSYGNLNMIGNNVYYNSRRGSFMFDLDSKKETDLKVNLIFSAGYKKALAISGSAFQVVDVPKGPVTIDKPISLAGVKKLVDYHQEWMQIYNETLETDA